MDRVREQLKKKKEVKKPKLPEEDKLKDPALTGFRKPKSIFLLISSSATSQTMSNFNLTILGEVTRPGMFKVYQSQINLFEAISLAGNMTNFAKRDAVKIIRQTDNGSEIVTVDMGSADILSSPYYYLKPNDIIYVEPLKIKQWGFTTFPYSTVFSVISLAFTAIMMYFSLKKSSGR